MCAIILANVNCQITCHIIWGKAPPPPKNVAQGALPPNNALLLVYVTDYRMLGALSTFKDIALSDSVGYLER